MYIFQPDRYLLRTQLKTFAHYIGGRVLDIGAGEVDRYSGFFRYAEYKRLDHEHGDTVDIVGTAYAIPAPDQSFDSVVCTQVFEHLEDPQKASDEMYRILKSGGYAIVTVPQMNELHEEPRDFFRYTRYGLNYVFERSGFTVVEVDQRGGYYATLAQMKIRHMIDRYSLYKHPFLGKLLGFLIKIYGRVAIARDARDTSVANRKHAIGWCVVLQKK